MMRHALQRLFATALAVGVGLGCAAEAPEEPAAASPQATAQPASPAPAPPPNTSPAPPPSTSPAPPPAGGSSLLAEQMTAIAVQNTLMESQMQADRAARAGGQVAKEQLKQIDADRTQQMEDILQSMEE